MDRSKSAGIPGMSTRNWIVAAALLGAGSAAYAQTAETALGGAIGGGAGAAVGSMVGGKNGAIVGGALGGAAGGAISTDGDARTGAVVGGALGGAAGGAVGHKMGGTSGAAIGGAIGGGAGAAIGANVTGTGPGGQTATQPKPAAQSGPQVVHQHHYYEGKPGKKPRNVPKGKAYGWHRNFGD